MVNMECFWALGGDKEVNMHITHPANFHQLSDHDNAETIFLPHHPPKIIQCLLLGSLWEERGNNRERDKKNGSIKVCTLNKGSFCCCEISHYCDLPQTAGYWSLKIVQSINLLGIPSRRERGDRWQNSSRGWWWKPRGPSVTHCHQIKETFRRRCNFQTRITWERNAQKDKNTADVFVSFSQVYLSVSPTGGR